VANPRLMLRDDAGKLMDVILKDGEAAQKAELIKVFRDFLKNEQIRMIKEDSENGNNII
jgi:hypothetical protein